MLAAYYRAHPADAFIPSPALRGLMDNESKRIFVRAANRVGKSSHMAVKLVKAMLARPNGRYRAVGVSYRQSIEVVSKLLAQYIPKVQLVPGCVYTETNGWIHHLIRLTNGTICQIKSSDQKAIAHAGENLDGVWIDEIPPQDILLECATRVMSKEGFLWVDATPIGRPVQYLRDAVEADDSVWHQYVVPLSKENCPWYSREQIERWITEARAFPDSFEQKINGAWEGTTQARAFVGFDSTVLFDDFGLLPQKCRWGIGVDHGEGIGNQCAVLVCWDREHIWILDEYVSTKPTTPKEDARAILGMLQQNGLAAHNVHSWVGDTNSSGKSTPGQSINKLLGVQIAELEGYRWDAIKIGDPVKGPRSVDMGERLLDAGFLRSQVRVHARCTHLVHALRHYRGGGKDEELKHILDALRYVAFPVLTAFNKSYTSPRQYQLQ